MCHTAANSKRFSPIVFICRVPAAQCHVLCLFHPLPRLCSIVAFFFYTCAILPEHFCFGIAFCATFSKQLTRFCVCFDITIAAIILFSTHKKKMISIAILNTNSNARGHSAIRRQFYRTPSKEISLLLVLTPY